MALLERKTTRRKVLAGGAAAGVATVFQPVLGQEQQAAINAKAVEQVPGGPDDRLWGEAEVVQIPLNPQNIVLPRLTEAGTTAIDVRALYDSQRVGFLLEWQDVEENTELGTVHQYRDAVAIQFPEDISISIPSFMMGQLDNAVVIYHWLSDWQFGSQYDVDEAYPNMYSDWYQYSGVDAGEMAESTDYLSAGAAEYVTAAAVGNVLADPLAQEVNGPVQKMRAEGFGTLEPDQTQDAQGAGDWQDGSWRVAISIPREQAMFTFEEGVEVPLTFAVWEGSRSERNGQKAYSTWSNMSLGISSSPAQAPSDDDDDGFLVRLLGGIGAAVAAVVAVLLGIRLRRRGQESSE